MLCTEIVSDSQNNFCTQHIMFSPCSEKRRASDKDLPVLQSTKVVLESKKVDKKVPDLGIHVPHLSVPSEKDQVRSEESSTATKPMIEVIDVQNNSQVQVNLCQKLLFLHQLTHNMTTDCSLNYKFNT